ncbi:pre-mRNA-splicing factor CWC26 [Pyrrhoderma noxium]|uniref:Pre-mRNA-splicing factor CWC26 n=1 Tax=Pyrrhoderma noxium TaxID=2282107 RepID=A0A286U670_9AGAM|nr:pre-mRNA-splicing factor CWC26 [Pyrrhoderma noxium]
MQAYLAEKYMSGKKADAILAKMAPEKKKKKRKTTTPVALSSGSGMRLVVDEDDGWMSKLKSDEDEEDLSEAIVAPDRSFKKRRVVDKEGAEDSGWAVIREGVKQEESPLPDEKPQIVDTPFTGGLLSASELKKRLPNQESGKGKARRTEQTEEEREEERLAQETVYRDASGRKIDTKAERAEAARKKREKEEREAQKMEWGKGLVQREDEAKRKAQLEKERNRDLAVYADDKELNEDLKARDRWNDPAAQFLTKKKSKGPQRPEYKGPPPPPNRFGIKPGYRWDGVDRGNGFEKKYFQAQNTKKRKVLESYQWSVDDM